MRLRADTRGQAIQVGAVLLFAALITAYASYQAFVVPDQNRQVEFNHNKQVQGDLLDLRNTIASPRRGGESVSVQLGTQYPSRALLLNPPAPSGSLRTLGTSNASRNLTIQNATGVGETGDFWNGTDRTYPTGAFVYRPNYNEYEDVPTYYENTVLFSQGSGGAVPLSGQRLVDGEDLNLVTFNGSLSITRTATTSVDVRSVSVSDTTVTVTNDTANVTVAVPTRLSKDRWRTLLDGEFVSQGGHVAGIRNRSLGSGVEVLLVDLEPDVEYELRMAKVGFGTNLRAAERGYLAAISGDGASIQADQSQRLVAEVRDTYNNPVSGQEVNATVVGGSGSVEIVQNVTGSDGRAAFRYDAPGSATTATVNLSFGDDPGPVQNATYTVTVAGGGTTDGDAAYETYWFDTSDTGVSCDTATSPSRCTLDAGETTTMDLTVDTTPTAGRAPIDYGINNSTVAGLDQYAANAGPDGRHTNTLTAGANVTVSLFTASGGSGDELVVDVVGFGTGSTTGVAPSVTSVSVSDRSNNGQGARFDVSWSVSDTDGDLAEVEVVLVTETIFGDVEQDSDTTTVSGGSASGTSRVNDPGGCGDQYRIDVVVTDQAGRETTESRTVTASC